MKLNRKHFAEFFRTDYYLISVRFSNDTMADDRHALKALTNKLSADKEYTYKVPKNLNLEIYDKVVVMVASAGNESLKTVWVTAINREAEIEEDSPFQYKWIVGKYDDIMADHIANVEKDQTLKRAVHKLEVALERVSLKKQMQAALEELDPAEREELQAAFGVTNLLGGPDGEKKESKEAGT